MVRTMHSVCMTEHITDNRTGIHVCVFITTFYLVSISRAPNEFLIWLYLYLCIIFLLGTSQAIAIIFLAYEVFVACHDLSDRDASWFLIDTSDTVLCVRVFILLSRHDTYAKVTLYVASQFKHARMVRVLWRLFVRTWLCS